MTNSGARAVVLLTAIAMLPVAGCRYYYERYQKHPSPVAMVDLYDFAIAGECYREAKGSYPQTTSIDTLIEALNPFSPKPLKRLDPWGHPYRVESGPHLRVASDGGDGIPDRRVWRIGPSDGGGTDSVVTDGYYTRWVAGYPAYVMHTCGPLKSASSSDPHSSDPPFEHRYTYRIVARWAPITLDKFHVAIASIKNARFSGDRDVEVCVDPDCHQWEKVFHFDDGCITYRPLVNRYGYPAPAIEDIVKELKFRLDAHSVGEEGE